MAIIPGYKIVLQFDAKTLVGYRSHSMDVEADMGDKTTGASTNQWKEYQPLFKGMEFSVEGLYDPTAGSNKTLDDVLDLLRQGTQFTAKWGNTENGSIYYSASAYVRRVHQEGPYDDLSSYTVDVLITGEPTKGTVGA
jgi:hypothetical protein